MSRRFRTLLAGYNLTPSQWGVLSSLWQQDGQPALQVGQRVDLLPGTLTGVLRKLEQNGWVLRRKEARDKRISRIWLTPRGKRLKGRLMPEIRLLIAGYFANFSESELRQFSAFIDRLRTDLAARENENGPSKTPESFEDS